MSTQKKMENDLRKYLFGKVIEGRDLRRKFTDKEVKEISDQYDFNIKLEILNDYADGLGQNITNVLTTVQFDEYDDHFELDKKVKEYIKNEFDSSKYSNLNKGQLERYIYTYSGQDMTDQAKGDLLLEDEYERCAVYFLYLSKYVE